MSGINYKVGICSVIKMATDAAMPNPTSFHIIINDNDVTKTFPWPHLEYFFYCGHLIFTGSRQFQIQSHPPPHPHPWFLSQSMLNFQLSPEDNKICLTLNVESLILVLAPYHSINIIGYRRRIPNNCSCKCKLLKELINWAVSANQFMIQ